MSDQRPTPTLPGGDPLVFLIVFGVIWLGMSAFFLIPAAIFAVIQGSHGGHLPWPIAQWTLTTPLGTLAIAAVGGLACGFAIFLLSPLHLIIIQPVDVTDLPLAAWPHPPSFWRGPASQTLAERWFGLGKRQRAWNGVALALVMLLLLGLLVALGAAFWYSFQYSLSHISSCIQTGCPPNYEWQLTIPAMFLSVVTLYAYQAVWIAWMQRRCGVWFRGTTGGGLSAYIRRPGVTPEAATAALQRYTRGRRPLAQVSLFGALALVPLLLLTIGSVLLAHWLSTQWIPG